MQMTVDLFHLYFRGKIKSKSHTQILNLKKFNRHINYRHFKMDLSTALTTVTKKLLHGQCRPSHYLLFSVSGCSKPKVSNSFQNRLYKFLCLPNGLTTAPKMFTKLLKSVFSYLRKLGHEIISYLDDSFTLGDPFNQCKTAVTDTAQLFHNMSI